MKRSTGIATTRSHAKAGGAVIATTLIVSGAIALGNGIMADTGAGLTTREIVTRMARAVDENYVYPDKGDAASAMLLERLEDGAYDGLAGAALAQTVRADLVGMTDDLHFGVQALPEGWVPDGAEELDGPDQGPRAPYGFVDVRRIDGNIGYIDLRGFSEVSYIGDTVEAAMRMVQGCGSLIFDLRRNGGGDPDAVALISSYLFDPGRAVHLNSLYSRPSGKTTEYWTRGDIDPALAMPDTPVYVLTSAGTFSAAEEFSYNLKNLKRATIVGETTGGGAHPVDAKFIGVQFVMIIPTSRAINPITGTNWEGTGVEPDIACAADEALDVATGEALRGAIQGGDESAAWGLATVNARLHPIGCDEQLMNAYAGSYGDRHIRVHDGRLEYQREGVKRWRGLVCFEKDRFVIDGVEGFILEFARDGSGAITHINGLYQQGHTDQSVRVD